MNLLTLLGSYTFTLMLAALIPGPGMTGLLFKTLSHGSSHGLKMLAGLVTGDLLYLILVLSGLSWLGHALSSTFAAALILCACAYLLYLACRFWSSALSFNLSKDTSSTSSSYKEGLLITLANPKTISFYLALVPSILGTAALHPEVLISVVLLTIVTLLAAGSLYIFSAVKIKHLLSSPSALSMLLRATAIMMAGFACSTIYLEIVRLIR
ncbi:LysE family translocator [Acinetobacter pragensis]|uniref:Lysine transporter LysE n=1 Tax=Acinetobacter pragensis TaxID=1806892 RepID=A0A151Y6A7_9GAMM|nr:LysE family translocator [Acinetobacter pragensis]KYQ73563.1 hypothetical protein AZH43_00125 [Acinetobacter pragensis]